MLSPRIQAGQPCSSANTRVFTTVPLSETDYDEGGNFSLCAQLPKNSCSIATSTTGSHARKALAAWCNRRRGQSLVNWLRRFHSRVLEWYQRHSGHSPTDRSSSLAASTSALMVAQVVIGLPCGGNHANQLNGVGNPDGNVLSFKSSVFVGKFRTRA